MHRRSAGLRGFISWSPSRWRACCGKRIGNRSFGNGADPAMGASSGTAPRCAPALQHVLTNVATAPRRGAFTGRGDVSSPCDASAAPINATTSIDFFTVISGAPSELRATRRRHCQRPSGPASVGAICPATAGLSALRFDSRRSIPASLRAPPLQHVLTNVRFLRWITLTRLRAALSLETSGLAPSA
jgi:hypothetical protein